MLNNTYDASGYRYGILATRNDDIQRKMSENAHNEEMDWNQLIRIMIDSGNLTIIDFEDIDGLTLKELKNYKTINKDILLFVMYDRTNIREKWPRQTDEFNIRSTIIKSLSSYPENITIDDIMEEVLYKYVDDTDDFINKRIKCFLQRYKYGTKEETDKKILQKINNRK